MSVTKRRWWLPGWFRRKKHVPEAIAPVEIDSTDVLTGETPTPAAVHTDVVTAETTSPAAVRTITEQAQTTVTDFTVADDSVVATQDVLDDLERARPIVDRLAADVLATEGPIPTLRLVSTVARKLGFDRIGDTRRQDLSALITGSQTVADGFVWPAGTAPETWRGVRHTVNRDDRAVAEISPTEIANAIVLVLTTAGTAEAVDRETVVRSTADLLGYGRIGESARRWIDLAIAAAITQGRLAETDGALTLP